MFKKAVTFCVGLSMMLGLAACGGNGGQSDTTPAAKDGDTVISRMPSSETAVALGGDTEPEDTPSILIAYFSWSGHTKQLAEEIQAQIGGELFEIQPETPYTDNINELSGIALQEQRDDTRPPLSGQVDSMEQYGVVFIGYPNWWNNMPMPVFTFLEQYDFSGKTVIPFTTYGDGVWGKSVSSLEEKLDGATIADGLAVQEHELQDVPEKVTEWLGELELIQ